MDLYFTHVHPVFPIIQQSHFMAEYSARYAKTDVLPF
jgi:hypothetical protein